MKRGRINGPGLIATLKISFLVNTHGCEALEKCWIINAGKLTFDHSLNFAVESPAYIIPALAIHIVGLRGGSSVIFFLTLFYRFILNINKLVL